MTMRNHFVAERMDKNCSTLPDIQADLKKKKKMKLMIRHENYCIWLHYRVNTHCYETLAGRRRNVRLAGQLKLLEFVQLRF